MDVNWSRTSHLKAPGFWFPHTQAVAQPVCCRGLLSGPTRSHEGQVLGGRYPFALRKPCLFLVAITLKVWAAVYVSLFILFDRMIWETYFKFSQIHSDRCKSCLFTMCFCVYKNTGNFEVNVIFSVSTWGKWGKKTRVNLSGSPGQRQSWDRLQSLFLLGCAFQCPSPPSVNCMAFIKQW